MSSQIASKLKPSPRTESFDCCDHTGELASNRFEKNIENYLTKTRQGEAFFRRLSTQYCDCIERRDRDVLLVMHPDGWVEVYSANTVKLHFFNLHPYCSTTAVRKAAWRALELVIPERLRRYLWPNATDNSPGLVACCQVKKRSFLGKLAYQWQSGSNTWQVPEDDGE